MKRLSEEAKKSIVEKALTRNGKGLSEIASLHNIGYPTLQKWIIKYKAGVTDSRNSNKSSVNSQITRSEQLQHLLATFFAMSIPNTLMFFIVDPRSIIE